jgi:molybdopterin biosynthesis enzyme MoaB
MISALINHDKPLISHEKEGFSHGFLFPQFSASDEFAVKTRALASVKSQALSMTFPGTMNPKHMTSAC